MASTQGAIGGYATLTIDGEVWNAENIKYKTSGFKRETVVAQTAVAGFTKMPTQGSISATLIDRKDKPIAEIMGKETATVIVRLVNGKVITGNQMWLVEQPELNTQEGKFEVNFEGDDVSEDIA
ncbi:phage tail tube protein [Commensalibacter oyaizuii]|uniref:Phage tail tube protein n=1 Tax=Commensalibacter oyaizuii TaxID=3043873 RepID=A0ABT6Q3S6_9PROT|nr:phage tail tube protein [Commensalibacter sp. TBRC 16381]MDI2091623.1 phage tail tube protein [Commensalibacter sp. TBRC 16381]